MIKACEDFWVNPEFVTWIYLENRAVYLSLSGSMHFSPINNSIQICPPYGVAHSCLKIEFPSKESAKAFVYQFPNTRPVPPLDLTIGTVSKDNKR